MQTVQTMNDILSKENDILSKENAELVQRLDEMRMVNTILRKQSQIKPLDKKTAPKMVTLLQMAPERIPV
jgi:hypothetical protein